MTENAGRNAGLFNFRVAVEHRPRPTSNPPRPAAPAVRRARCRRPLRCRRPYRRFFSEFCTRASIISIDGTTYSVARRTSTKPIPGPLERLLENKGQFRLDARHAIIGVPHLCAIRHQHRVQQVTVIRLVDLRGLLHGLGGQPDLVADQFRAAADLVLRDRGRNRIGVLDGESGHVVVNCVAGFRAASAASKISTALLRSCSESIVPYSTSSASNPAPRRRTGLVRLLQLHADIAEF